MSRYRATTLDHVDGGSGDGRSYIGRALMMHAICNGMKGNDAMLGRPFRACLLIWLATVNEKTGAVARP